MFCPSCSSDDHGITVDRAGEVVRRCWSCGLTEEASISEIAIWVEMFESPEDEHISGALAAVPGTEPSFSEGSLTEAILRPSTLLSGVEIAAKACPIPATGGVYGCWFDVVPPLVDVSGCEAHDGRYLLYVGTSGNLARRMGDHYLGTAEGSTLRKTLGCLLADKLDIRLSRQGKALTFAEGEAVLSDWISQNMSIAWVSTDERHALEAGLIATADLPLNLEGNSRNPFHQTLTELRWKATRSARN